MKARGKRDERRILEMENLKPVSQGLCGNPFVQTARLYNTLLQLHIQGPSHYSSPDPRMILLDI
jgi:hypothetical protein